MLRFFRSFAFLLCLTGVLQVPAQQVTLLGLRSLQHAGAFHGLRQDSAGNLYTLFDAQDGVRLLKLNSAGTQLLAEATLGQAGDSGIALDLDAAGNIYVAGTSSSQGSVAGTSGTAFPDRAGTRTNSFVARFSPALQQQWLTFCGAEPLAVTSVAATGASVLVTGSIFSATLPVTGNGIQQSPAPNSGGNGFVESFAGADGSLQYSTYLTGANGDTTPAAITADGDGNAYIAGLTTATGYPTTAALVPVFRAAGDSNVSGFVTKLTPAGDGFVFSTFVPGNGLTSAALDPSGNGSLLLSGDVAPGLFPLQVVQRPMAASLRYQTALRLSRDGSAVLSSTLLGPATESLLAAGANGTAWAFASTQNAASVALLPVLPVESSGNAFAVRINGAGAVDRAARFGGLPVTNSGYASLPAIEGGVAALRDGTIAIAGSLSPTLSSDLLGTQTYDAPFVFAPNTLLPSTLRDALPPAGCSGSACSGSAGLLAMLASDASAPSLALSIDDQPNLILRNLGTASATGLQINVSGLSLTSSCGTTLAAGGECAIALVGSGPGSITVQASNAAAFVTPLPATTQGVRAISALPRELDFGVVSSASATATRNLTVSNLGTSLQTFASQDASTLAGGYTLTETGSTCTPAGSANLKVLAAGGTCTVTLGLRASTSSANDAPVGAHWQIGTQDVLVTGYVQAAALSLSATTVDFGRQFPGGLRSSRYLHLSNASDRAIAHSTVESSNGAFDLIDECPAMLQPQAVCRIAMNYQAAAAPSSDAMTLNVDGLQATVLGETLPQPSVSGSAANPNLRVSTTAIPFSNAVHVTGASSESHAVTISNAGTLPFPLTLGTAGDFVFASGCPTSLNGGASCTAVVIFTPTAAGTRQGLLAITAGSSAPAYVALSGTGTAILPLGSGNVSFADVPLGTPAVMWFKVSQAFSSLTASSSDPNFTVLLVEDTGYGHGQPPASSFSATTTGSCLGCYLGIQFLPTAAGAHAGTVSLSSPGGGKPASLSVNGNGVPLTGLILTPVSQDFLTVPVHSSSASVKFILTNGTADAVATTGVAVSSDFNVTVESTGAASCSTGNLLPGAACLVPVSFTPSAGGLRTGSLTVSTSAGQVSSSLGGIASDDPGVAFTPGELQFDNVPGAAATQQSIHITNTAASNLTIGTPTVSDSHFAASSTCASLAPGAGCDVSVTYTAGSFLASGTLTLPVTSSPAGAPGTTQYAVALMGLYTADTAGLQIVPGEHATVNFGASAVGTPALQRVLHVNNLSAKALTIAVESPRQFAVAASTCSLLASGAGCDLTLQYTSLTSADVTGTVFVQGTPADGSATQTGLGYLQGYGTGKAASLAVSGNISPAGVLNFGQIASGQNSTRTVTLTNPVSAAAGTSLTVHRIRSEFPFLSTSNCGSPLAPGQSCTVTVVYAPMFQAAPGSGQTGTEADTGTLTIESDGANSPQFVDLAGSATPAFVATPSSSAPVAAYDTSQGSLSFTSTAVGTASASQTVTLSNTGTATVHISGVLTSSGFRSSSSCGTLVAGATCDIAVQYIPQNATVTLGALEIQSDSSASLEFVSLLGGVVTPPNPGPIASLSVTPESLDFSRVLVGRTASQLLTVANTGTLPVVLGARSVTGNSSFALAAAINSNTCPAPGGTLTGGASCTVAIAFTPASTGTLRGTVSVASSATSEPLTVPLSGVGTQPQLLASPTSLSFGDVAVGSTATQAFTLVNSSNLPADGLHFSATAGFSVNSNCGITTIQAGSSCAITVTYAPPAAGISTGLLSVSSTDPASPLTVPLSGNGIQATGATLSSLTATPSALNFGNVTVNGNSSRSFTLSNATSATVNGLLFTATTGFTVSSSCGTALNAYSTCPVLVVFSPMTAGTAIGTVSVQNSDSTSPLTVALTGTGTSVQPQLVATPGSLAFGNVPVGSSSTQSITVTNSSASTVNSINVVASGAFTKTSSCGANLNPGSSCNVQVTYEPATAGAATGTLTIQSTDPASPLTLALSGTGTLLPPQLSLSPSALNFGSLPVGSSATLTAVLLNTSSTPVTRVAVAATPGFTVANGCGTTLAPGSSCPIAVTYTAGAAGLLTGSLTVSSSDSNSPLTAALIGTGTVIAQAGGFTLTVNGSSSANATVQSGLPASFALAVTPMGSFSGVIALTCTADSAVAYAACSLVPPTVALAGAAASSTVTINTVSAVNVGALQKPQRRTEALWCLTPALLLLLWRRKRPATLLVLLTGLFLVNGCGGGGDPRIRYVNPGTYSFHVTATSTSGPSLSQAVSLTLTVTPR